MDVLTAIRTRRSVSKVTGVCPPREVVEEILDAATWAPNHRVTEPWRFFVLAGEERARLGEVIAHSRTVNIAPDDPVYKTEFDRARQKALRSPVIITVAVVPSDAPKVVEIEEIEAGAAAVQNLLLAAHARGLGAIWRTGDPAYDPAVKAFFGLPESAHILGFVYLGYAAIEAQRATHTPAEAVTTWMGWDG